MARDVRIETMIEEQRESLEAVKASGMTASQSALIDLINKQLDIMDHILNRIPDHADSAGYLHVQMINRRNLD